MSIINWGRASAGAVASGTNFGGGVGTDGDITWVNNGLTAGSRYDGNANHNYQVSDPDEVIITLVGSKSISQVNLWFEQSDTGTETTDPTTSTVSTSSALPVDFTVDTWNGSSYVNQATITGNNKALRQITFGAVSTNKIRVGYTNDPGSGLITIREIEVLEITSNVASLAGVGAFAPKAPTPVGVGSFSGHGAASIVSKPGPTIEHFAGAGSVAPVGVRARRASVGFAGSGKAYAHPPYNLNYKLALVASSLHFYNLANGVDASAPALKNDVLWGAGAASVSSFGTGNNFVDIVFAAPHWIAGARIYSGIELATATVEPGDADTYSSRGVNAAWKIQSDHSLTPTTVYATYTGANNLLKQRQLVTGDLIYTDQITIGPWQNIADLYEVQIIGLGNVIVGEYQDSADASSAVLRKTKQAWSESANGTAAVVGHIAANLVSSANATSIDASKGKHTLALAETAGATDAAIPVVVAKISESAAASATMASKRPLSLTSSGNATSVQAAKIVHTEVSTGDGAANTTPGRNVTQSEESDANATSTVVGTRKVVVTEVSTGNSANVDASHRITVQTLLSQGDISAVIVTRAKLHATEVSNAVAGDSLRLAPTPLELPVYWTNSRSMAAAQWRGLAFNSFIEVGGVMYAADVNGIKRLSAQGNDNTAIVSSEIGWDLQDWGSGKKKRLQSVYIPGFALGPFRFRVVCEQGGYDYQTHLASSTVPTKHRAPLGRGLNSVYYRWGVLQDFYFSVTDPITVHLTDTTREI